VLAQASDLNVDDEPAFQALRPNEVCDRLAVGTKGKTCTMITNTFPLRFTSSCVYRYIMEFEPEIPPERIKQRAVVKNLFKQEINKAYGITFFTGTELLGLTRCPTNEVRFGPSGHGCYVTIRFQRQIMTGPENQTCQEVSTIINVMSKKFLRRLGMMLIDRSYFYPEPKSLAVVYHQSVPQNKQYVMKIFSGFNVSVQPCLMGPLMCIDLVSRVMQETSCRSHMTKLMESVRQGGGTKEQYQQRAKDLLVGSTVI
jgi:hypothetical protein